MRNYKFVDRFFVFVFLCFPRCCATQMQCKLISIHVFYLLLRFFLFVNFNFIDFYISRIRSYIRNDQQTECSVRLIYVTVSRNKNRKYERTNKKWRRRWILYFFLSQKQKKKWKRKCLLLFQCMRELVKCMSFVSFHFNYECEWTICLPIV